jgi:hypothetical protein
LRHTFTSSCLYESFIALHPRSRSGTCECTRGKYLARTGSAGAVVGGGWREKAWHERSGGHAVCARCSASIASRTTHRPTPTPIQCTSVLSTEVLLAESPCIIKSLLPVVLLYASALYGEARAGTKCFLIYKLRGAPLQVRRRHELVLPHGGVSSSVLDRVTADAFQSLPLVILIGELSLVRVACQPMPGDPRPPLCLFLFFSRMTA